MTNKQPLSDNPADWPIEVHEALDFLISRGFTWQDYKAALGAEASSDASEGSEAPSSPAEVGQATCKKCRGEGKVADTEDREPWSCWADLPPGSDLAVRLGVVKPIPCPACSANPTA